MFGAPSCTPVSSIPPQAFLQYKYQVIVLYLYWTVQRVRLFCTRSSSTVQYTHNEKRSTSTVQYKSLYCTCTARYSTRTSTTLQSLNHLLLRLVDCRSVPPSTARQWTVDGKANWGKQHGGGRMRSNRLKPEERQESKDTHIDFRSAH